MDSKYRKKIGILLFIDHIGFVYYLVSLIETLRTLEHTDQPDIVIFYNRQCKKYIDLITYKYASFIEIEYDFSSQRIPIYIKSLFLRKNLFINNIISKYQLDGLFPANDLPVKNEKTYPLLVSWIMDFQHKCRPDFFTFKNRIYREKTFKDIIKHSNVLILSSYNSLDHLTQFYRLPITLKVYVLPFVSTIKEHMITPIDTVYNRYDIKHPFFLVSNQFFAHKNHILVLKAIKLLKEEGLIFEVVFTGKTEDHRNINFFPKLLNYIEANSLQSHIKILGLIPREDQISLLKSSLSVIQPSLFEGWSTIIEDAKTINHQIICSSIPVHKEQLENNAFYFDADSDVELANWMRKFILNNIEPHKMKDDYNERMKLFASSFIGIFNN